MVTFVGFFFLMCIFKKAVKRRQKEKKEVYNISPVRLKEKESNMEVVTSKIRIYIYDYE